MVAKGVPFHRYVGFLVVDYTYRARWFMLVEILFSGAVGALDAIRSDDIATCRTVAIAALAVFVLYAMTLVALRPYCIGFHTAVYTPCAVLQMLGVAAVVVYLHMDSPDAPGAQFWLDAGALLPMTVMYALLGKEAVDFLMMLAEGTARCLRTKAKKLGSARDATDGNALLAAPDLVTEEAVEGDDAYDDPLLCGGAAGVGIDDDDGDDALFGGRDFDEDDPLLFGGDPRAVPKHVTANDWGDAATAADRIFASGGTMTQEEARRRLLADGGLPDGFDDEDDEAQGTAATAAHWDDEAAGKKKKRKKSVRVHTGKGGATALFNEISHGLSHSHTERNAVASLPPPRPSVRFDDDDDDAILGML